MKPELQKEITQLGLDYRLMTQFTSLVAVEERVITKDGKPQRVEVPVEMPDGVSYEHVYDRLEMITKLQSPPAVLMRKSTVGNGYGAGVGAGVGAGSAGGIGGGSYAANAASPSVSVFSATVKSRGKEPPQENPEPAPTGERAELESKLHPEIIKAFDCWKKSGEQCQMLQDGKLHVQIFLTGATEDVIAQLKVLGFESVNKNSSIKMLVGNLPVEKLPAIVKIAGVQFVAPVKM